MIRETQEEVFKGQQFNHLSSSTKNYSNFLQLRHSISVYKPIKGYNREVLTKNMHYNRSSNNLSGMWSGDRSHQRICTESILYIDQKEAVSNPICTEYAKKETRRLVIQDTPTHLYSKLNREVSIYPQCQMPLPLTTYLSINYYFFQMMWLLKWRIQDADIMSYICHYNSDSTVRTHLLYPLYEAQLLQSCLIKESQQPH